MLTKSRGFLWSSQACRVDFLRFRCCSSKLSSTMLSWSPVWHCWYSIHYLLVFGWPHFSWNRQESRLDWTSLPHFICSLRVWPGFKKLRCVCHINRCLQMSKCAPWGSLEESLAAAALVSAESAWWLLPLQPVRAMLGHSGASETPHRISSDHNLHVLRKVRYHTYLHNIYIQITYL